MLPVSLILLAIIALVLYILFGYVIPPPTSTTPRYFKTAISGVVIVLVLLLWFVLPVRVGG
jgi:hypothetical protein